MSVQVTTPEGHDYGDWGNNRDESFGYTIEPSGVLRIVSMRGSVRSYEISYAPHAWVKVQGDCIDPIADGPTFKSAYENEGVTVV